MKKYLYLMFIFVITFLSLCVFDSNVKGVTDEVYLIMTNPAEDSNTSITITWHTLIEGTYVEYTTKEDSSFSEPKKVDGIYEELTIYDGTTNGNVTDYKCYVTLTDLESDTEYIYRVGKTKMSDVHTFRTGGSEDFNFAVVSDIHVYTKLSTRLTTATKIINDFDKMRNLSFVISAGDTTAYGTHRGFWNDLCESDIIKNQFFAATPGNHDYYNSSATFLDSSYFNAYTKNPDNGPEGMKNTTYYFYYNNVLFISLNSEDACTNEEKRQIQRIWLNEVLEKNTSDFTVVFFHRSMYPGSGGNTGHAEKMKGAYQDLFDKYGVDLVIGGHDHVYVRTTKILNGTSSPDSTFGTTYISTTQIGDRVNSANNDYTDIIKKIGSGSGALLFSATKDKLSFEFYNELGEKLDGGVITSKMSSIEQKKLERETKISYNETFSNMSLSIYSVLFQRAINVKLYDGEEVVLDFRPEYNVTNYKIEGVSDYTKSKSYKLVITYRDGTKYEREYNIENKDFNISFEALDINCNVGDEVVVNITNSLNLDLEYSYEVDDEYIRIVDGKLVAIKAGTTTIKANAIEIGETIELAVTIKEAMVNVSYHLDGGILENQKDQFLKGEVISLGTPIKEGYNFIGWFIDENYTNEFVSQAYSSDLEVYAKWEIIPTENEKTGCNSATILYSSLLLLGLVLLRRKRF